MSASHMKAHPLHNTSHRDYCTLTMSSPIFFKFSKVIPIFTQNIVCKPIPSANFDFLRDPHRENRYLFVTPKPCPTFWIYWRRLNRYLPLKTDKNYISEKETSFFQNLYFFSDIGFEKNYIGEPIFILKIWFSILKFPNPKSDEIFFWKCKSEIFNFALC